MPRLDFSDGRRAAARVPLSPARFPDAILDPFPTNAAYSGWQWVTAIYPKIIAYWWRGEAISGNFSFPLLNLN